MRILYGVTGEGMGHATRSGVVLEHLVKEHDVHIVVSGRARDYLAERFENVHRVWGLSIKYEDNSVKNLQTLVQNLKGAVTGWPHNIRTYFDLVDKFEPDVVISDFESFSYFFGRNHFLPVISVDNMQVINRCKLDADLLAGFEDNFELIRGIVKSKLPGCFHYLITTFFFPPVHKERTTLVPPILRSAILGAESEPGEHLLVYQTSTSNPALLEGLKRSGRPCHIYGMRRELTEEQVEGNLRFRPFSEKGFIDDLRTAKCVVAGGGFTLMSEAVYLRKPMLSVPVVGQFEQVLNALFLEKVGYGLYAKDLEGDALGRFLERVPDCEKALAGYSQDGNSVVLGKLDEVLVAAKARKGQPWDEVSQS